MDHVQMVEFLRHSHVQQAWLSAVLALAPLVSKAIGALTGSRANARVQETALNNQQDTAAQNQFTTDQSNARSNLTTESALRKANESDALHSGLLQGLEDAGGTPGHLTGGLKPSAIVGGKSMGKQFQGDALARIAAGTPQLKYNTPGVTPAPQATGLDKFLNIVGGIAGATGLAGNIYNGMNPTSDSTGIAVNSKPGSLVTTDPSMVAQGIAPVLKRVNFNQPNAVNW